MIDAVLPVAAGRGLGELDRLDTLLASLARHAAPGLFRRVLVPHPPGDGDALRRAFAPYALPALFADERDLIGPPRADGWFRQQMLKLAAGELFGGPYLALDADLVLRRPLAAADLVRAGRGRVGLERREWHPDWWAGSAAVLGLPVPESPEGVGVTPQVLHAAGAAATLRRVEAASGRPWREALGGRYDWTEFCLYSLVGEAEGWLAELHFFEPLSSGCVWEAAGFAGWDPAGGRDPAAGGPTAAPFTLVNGASGVPPAAVRRRLVEAGVLPA